MMRSKMLRPFMLVVFPTLLVLAGCQNPFDPAAQGEPEPDTTVYGSLVIRSATVGASTVAPDLGNLKSSVSRYTVELVHQDGEYSTIERTDYQEGDAIPNVPVGAWTVTVTGLDVGNRAIARSTSSTDIVPGANALEFTLQPLQEATGILDYRLDWTSAPPTTVVDSLQVSLDPYPWGGGDTESLDFSDSGTQSLSTAGADVTVDFSARSLRVLGSTTQAGFYRMRIQPRRGNAEYAPIIEVVQVYDYLGSTETVTLSADDLTSPPPAPTGLTVVHDGSGSYQVTWTDASRTEAGYRLYIDGIRYPDASTTLPAGSEVTPNSITGQPGTSVTVTVESYNGFGSSSAEVEVIPIGLPGTITPSGTPANPTKATGDVTLDWPGFPGADSYNVYISTSQFTQDDLPQGDLAFDNASSGVVAPSLSPGTYYWTVEGRNSTGGLAAPIRAFEILPSGSPGLTFEDPDVQIAGVTVPDIERAGGQLFQLTPTISGGTPTAYQWFINGQSYATEATVEVGGGAQAWGDVTTWPGGNTLTLAVTVDGEVYSESFPFQVVN